MGLVEMAMIMIVFPGTVCLGREGMKWEFWWIPYLKEVFRRENVVVKKEGDALCVANPKGVGLKVGSENHE